MSDKNSSSACVEPEWILHHKFDTGLNADSVEFCTVDGYRHLLACGLYQLKEGEGEPSRRHGSLLLYHVSEESACASVACSEIHRIEDIDGILDMKWFPHLIGQRPALVVARADGLCCIYSFALEQQDSAESKLIASCAVADQGLSLSVDISPSSTSEHAVVLTTTSHGDVVCLHAKKQEDDADTVSYALEEVARWNAHGFEAWYAIFDVQDPAKVYSGGDDGKFKAVKMLEDVAQPVQTVRYDVGLCAMQFRPEHPSQLALGGYEQIVWLFDSSNLRTPLSQIDVGGGVWRIKWKQSDPSLLATATMYNGFHLLRLSDDLEFSVLLHFNNHTEGSLGYGVSWKLPEAEVAGENVCKGSQSSAGPVCLLATCSFYDHCLQIWSTPLGERK
ncbi:diphthine methyltransferase-like [Sycon ciliatum]|uniref:diphthine methyltransferase-like n=1 Tax=Sycon ciliatum TaxID=27933 RepID=UPI0020AA1B2F